MRECRCRALGLLRQLGVILGEAGGTVVWGTLLLLIL
jgi:hypothetical protein